MQIIISYQHFLSEVKFGGSLAKNVIWVGTPTIAFQEIENWAKLNIFYFRQKLFFSSANSPTLSIIFLLLKIRRKKNEFHILEYFTI